MAQFKTGVKWLASSDGLCLLALLAKRTEKRKADYFEPKLISFDGSDAVLRNLESLGARVFDRL